MKKITLWIVFMICFAFTYTPIHANETTSYDNVMLEGRYTELPSLLWEGDVVLPGLEPGLLSDGKEYYLFFYESPYSFSEGDSIKVIATVSTEKDLRGVSYNKAVVTSWLCPNSDTAVPELPIESQATKLIENGQLVFLKNGARYNVVGTKLQ